jgi:hypothetical protein
MSEIEMWLHTLPLNAQRERRGAVPISTLWLWGGGHSPREPLAFSDERARARFQRIHASEGWASALVNLCGLQERLAASPRSWADLAQDEHFDVDSVCALVPLAERGMFGAAVVASSLVGGTLDSALFLRLAFGSTSGWWQLAVAKAVIIAIASAIYVGGVRRAVPVRRVAA